MEPGVGSVLAELRRATATATSELDSAVLHAAGIAAPPSGATEPGADPAGPWETVSRLLEHAGFGALSLHRAESATPSSAAAYLPDLPAVREALVLVLADHERQSIALSSTMEASERLTQQVARGSELQRVSDERLAESKRSALAYEQQLEVARGRLAQQAEESEAAARAAERTTANLQQKLATLTQQLRARETETQRLQARLARELAESDAVQKQRERQVFHEVHGRAARPHSATDSRGLELISVYEAQRRSMQAELEELRASSRHLAADLRERDNLIARKDAFKSWRTPDEGVLLGKLQEAQREACEARKATQETEARSAEQLRVSRLGMSEAVREAEISRAHAAELELELSTRPTIKQLTDANATIEQLRTALPLSRQSALDAAVRPASAPRPHPAIDSADAIRRDREVHELGLTSLQAMPHATMLQILQDCCRELQLRDAQLLPAAMRKMCRALAALPPMENFIRDVCALALAHGALAGAADTDTGGHVPSTVVVLQILKRWAHELRQLRQLQDFVAVLSEALRDRALPGSAQDPIDVPAVAPVELAPRDILESVQELVTQERKALRALDTFQRADMHLKLQPDDLVSKLCTHFERLFEVRSTEGMLPKMNELYLFVNEQSNFVKVLRSMLGLDTSASSHVILAALRQTLDLSAARDAGEGLDASNNDGVGSQNGQSVVAAADETTGASKTLPQYIAIAAELRKLMHADSILELVPAVKELKQELADYRHANAQMRILVVQLCTTLAAGSSEAQIARRLKDLVSPPAES